MMQQLYFVTYSCWCFRILTEGKVIYLLDFTWKELKPNGKMFWENISLQLLQTLPTRSSLDSAWLLCLLIYVSSCITAQPNGALNTESISPSYSRHNAVLPEQGYWLQIHAFGYFILGAYLTLLTLHRATCSLPIMGIKHSHYYTPRRYSYSGWDCSPRGVQGDILKKKNENFRFCKRLYRLK